MHVLGGVQKERLLFAGRPRSDLVGCTYKHDVNQRADSDLEARLFWRCYFVVRLLAATSAFSSPAGSQSCGS